MSEPAGKSGKSKHNSEHFGGDAKGLVDDSGVEVNVGVQLSGDEVVVRQGDSLKLHGDVNQRHATNNGKDVLSDLANNLSTGVVTLVDTVTEAHQDLLSIFNSLHESGNVFDITDLFEHAEDSLVGTTVTGSVEGSDGTSKGGVNISLGGCHVTNSGGGAVELVLSVQDKENIDGTNNLGVDSEIFVGGVLVHHHQEILSVAEILIGGVDGLASAVTVASGSNSGSTAEDTVDMLVALLAGLVDVGTDVGWVGLGVE